MNGLIPIEHHGQRVLTTQQLAEGYDTDIRVISNNFNRNIDRYESGKHFYALSGQAKTDFCNHPQIDDGLKKAHTIYLWTEKGALLHAKSLNTDKAWEVYDHLVETYFRAKEMFSVPKSLPEALRMAAELAEKIEQDKPKVLFAETCQSSKDSILIRELAKVCSKNGKTIGQNNLFRELRKWGILNSQNEPYQKYIDNEYFEIIERPIHTNDGVILKFTPKVLPKGQKYIMNRLQNG